MQMNQVCKILPVLVLVLTLHSFLHAQVESDHSETSKKEQRRLKKEKNKEYLKIAWKQPYPNPYRAAVLSMAVPGAGQLYNRRYWKAPIVWGGFYGLFASVKFNKDFRDRFNTAYGLQVAGLEHEFTGIINDAETLRRWRNKYDKQLQTTYVGFVGLYILNVLDAYVDAHLKSFDIDEDITLSVRPVINPSFGVGVVLSPK